MAETFLQMQTLVKSQATDTNGARFTPSEIKESIKRAHRMAYPYWFEDYKDEATYTGAGAIAADTTEIVIPAAFQASGSRGAGRIYRIEARMTDGTVANPAADFFPLTRRNIRRVDRCSSPTPRIYFNGGWLSRKHEIRIYGIRPFSPPVNDADSVQGTDEPNFTEWLIEKSLDILFGSRQTTNANDNMGASTRRIMAQQMAKQIADERSMKIVGEIIYPR